MTGAGTRTSGALFTPRMGRAIVAIMRTFALLLAMLPAFACLNDRTTPQQEAEFRAAYKDLPAAPMPPESKAIVTSAGGLAIGTALALFGLAIGWRVLRDRA